MRLAILGGGGFRVPLVYRALVADGDRPADQPVDHVVLHDVDASRLAVIEAVLAEQARAATRAPRVTSTTDLDEALRGADVVFSAIRAGGLAARAVDERVALDHHLVGQETVGAGGVAYALRSVPVALDVAERVARLCPQAWVINFTNPAGLVTEAMSAVLGDRVIGICDSPVALVRRAARALGLHESQVVADYAGLNHLGWVRSLHRVEEGTDPGADLLPGLLADPDALATFEEGALFGPRLLATLGVLPNEYLHYYYFAREATAAARAAGATRGAYLAQQQSAFYDAGRTHPSALARWERTRAEREATYMAENRQAVGGGERHAADLVSGGYEEVALDLMRALWGGAPARLVLNVRNRGTLACLDADAVVEVPTLVDSGGPRPIPTGDVGDYGRGLVVAVKAVERAVIEAVRTRSREAALRALVLHPLVDSAAVAEDVLGAYQRALPQLSYLR